MIPRSFFIALFSILVIESNSILAQDLDSAQAMIKKIFSISGEIGTYGELYSIAGQPERRPKSTGRIFFRPVLNLFNLFQIPFEFFISSEGSSAKQNINHFGINPSWDWGILHLGDFTNEFSNYTLSGINIRGAGVDIKPGLFRLSIASGFTQRSVPGGAQDGSFKRFLFSAKLGLGKDESTFVDLIFLRAKDELSSLNQNTTSITIISPNGNDVLEIGTLQTIRWNSFNLNSGIKIEISRDGGNSYELLADQQPNVGFFNWMVTPPATFNAIIRLSSVADSSITDVSDNIFTLASGVQSQIFSNIDDVINENAVLPQENLVVGTKGRIVFADNIVSLEFDGAGSIYTRDIRSSELDSADIPDFLTKIFKPRTGTNYDFAFNTSLNLNLLDVNTKLGYKRIGPGYNSLGTSYLLNDIQEYSIFNSFRISKTAVNIIYIHQNDNLLTQKQFTTARNIVNAGINTPIYSNWIAGFSVNFIKMENNAADSIKTDFNSLIFNSSNLN